MTDQPYELQRAAQRMRRRDAEARKNPRSRPEETGDPLDIEALMALNPGDDPPEYLEARRLALIRALIQDASQTCDRQLRAKICINLLRFSSMGRVGVDVSATVRRDDLPDLSKFFNTDDLSKLAGASDEVLQGFAQRIDEARMLGDGGGHGRGSSGEE